MCRTIHTLLQTVICGSQMLVRVFMTIILMIENLIRMILQTLYNFISFMLQMLSLIPICIVFLLTARLKCFMCGGGGTCPVNRGGACDCIMSAVAILILFLIFRATGILDKVFYSIGYTKARIPVHRFVPTPGDITECSRNDTDYEYEEISTTLTETEVDHIYTSTLNLIELSTAVTYSHHYDHSESIDRLPNIKGTTTTINTTTTTINTTTTTINTTTTTKKATTTTTKATTTESHTAKTPASILDTAESTTKQNNNWTSIFEYSTSP